MSAGGEVACSQYDGHGNIGRLAEDSHQWNNRIGRIMFFRALIHLNGFVQMLSQDPFALLEEPTVMVYIRQDKLPKLKEYKYSGVDHSLLSQYVLKPFYTHVVIKCFPMWMAAQNVMKARRARGQKTRVALLGLLTFAAAWVLIAAYLFLQPLILHHHLVPFIFYAGLINAYSVGRMIISHLTKSRFPRGNVLIYPLIYGVADSMGPWLQEHIGVGWPSALGNDVYQVAFVFMCLGLAVGVHGSFIVDVIWTICDYLDIWCLTIKYPYQPVKENIEKERKGQ
ncbi:Phosphotransferase [Ascochyta clinopodiicola]|nr:Phosphotransferase [Ascochyta clinopodiicola]